jgi:hypothetical protein
MTPQGHLHRSLLTAAWLTAVTVGLFLLADYSSRPGAAARPPAEWPVAAEIARDPVRLTALMFVHPHCPCSRASLAELEVLMHRAAERVDVRIIFTTPAENPAAWSQSDLWERAAAHRDWQVLADPDARLARQFGVKTSGHVLLYDRKGRLQYAGGVTPGRGHVGESGGQAAVRALVAGQSSGTPTQCAVFGCALADSSRVESAGRSP